MKTIRTNSTDNEYRASAPAYPPPAHPVRHAMLRVLSMIGLGIGGVAAMDDEEAVE